MAVHSCSVILFQEHFPSDYHPTQSEAEAIMSGLRQQLTTLMERAEKVGGSSVLLLLLISVLPTDTI